MGLEVWVRSAGAAEIGRDRPLRAFKKVYIFLLMILERNGEGERETSMMRTVDPLPLHAP